MMKFGGGVVVLFKRVRKMVERNRREDGWTDEDNDTVRPPLEMAIGM